VWMDLYFPSGASLLDTSWDRLIFIGMQLESAGRELTHDEKKAAEAAFTGVPFNPEWSERAWKVYEGIMGVMGNASPVVLYEQELQTVEIFA
jgi:hypothetical protein